MCGQCGGDSDSEYDDPSEINREAIEAYLSGGSKAVAIGTIAAPVERAAQEGNAQVEKALLLLRSDFSEMTGAIPKDDTIRRQRLHELLDGLKNRSGGNSEQKVLWMSIANWDLIV